MTVAQLPFLEKRLSTVRSEYLPVVVRNTPELLRVFDSIVLGGYSSRREHQMMRHSGYWDAIFTRNDSFGGEEDRPLYQELSTKFASLRGEEREAFLYGLRSMLVRSQRRVKRVEGKMDKLADLTDKVVGDPQFSREHYIGVNLSLAQLQALRGLSSGYRDIYMVMVDTIRQ